MQTDLPNDKEKREAEVEASRLQEGAVRAQLGFLQRRNISEKRSLDSGESKVTGSFEGTLG